MAASALTPEVKAWCLKELEEDAADRRERLQEQQPQQGLSPSDRRLQLIRNEQALTQRIRLLERQLDDLQDQLDIVNRSARGKPKSAARRQADYLRRLKGDLVQQINNARNVRDGIRAVLNNSQ